MNYEQDIIPDIDPLLEMAWVIIANAGNGDWHNETDEWQDAATKWRNEYHKRLNKTNG